MSKNDPAKKWVSKNVATIDLDTGEVVPGHSVQIRKKVYVGDYVSVIQSAALAVAMDREMTEVPLRVLKYLESILGYENAIPVSQLDVSEKLGINKGNVSKAFRLLLSKGIVEKIESPSLKPVYRLNPNYGWRGKHGKWLEQRGAASPLKLIPGGADSHHHRV